MKFRPFLCLLSLLIAAPVSATTAYRTSGPRLIFGSPAQAVAITGFEPFSFVTVGIGWMGRWITTSCNGYVRVDPAPAMGSTSFVWGSQVFDYASAPRYPYRCLKDADGISRLHNQFGPLPESSLPAYFLGELDNRYYARILSSPGISAFITFPNVPARRAVRADACGMITLRESNTVRYWSNVVITLENSSFTIGSIPLQTSLPRCIRVGETYKLYQPN